MEGPSAFSSDGAEVIARPVDLVDQAAKTGSLGRDDEDLAFGEYYEVEYTVREILRRDFKRIALQFSDDMLGDSVPVYTALKKGLHAADADGEMSRSLTVDLARDTRSLFVLADTSYGSCCVDEVAAQHVNADVVVHYGHACMSPTSRLPVLYISGKRNVDHRRVVESFYGTCAASAAPVVIFQEGCYNHCIPRIKGAFEARDPSSRFHAQIPSSYQEPGRAQCSNGASPAEAPISRTSVPDDATILYIGGQTLALTNLLMTHGGKNVYRFDPKTQTCKLESWRTNKLLMKRYHAVLRAKDADVFGILIGTLGVASYLPLISHLRTLLKKAHKKSYTVSVGKLNPAKLANFAEIECFVLVACPENSVVESKEFFRPIVTPFELEMALGVVPAWSGRYILDFEQVIAEVQDSAAYGDGETAEEDGGDEPHFSLITGKLVTSKRYGDRVEEENKAKGNADGVLVSRSQETTVGSLIGSAAGEFLQTRSWQGLEQRMGMDEPSILEQGRDGIAKGYRGVDH